MAHRNLSCTAALALLLAAALLLPAGCGSTPQATPPPTAAPATAAPTAALPTLPPAPTIGELTPSVGSPLGPGEEIGIQARVDGAPGVTITYQWTIPEGKGAILDGQGTSAITYRAPLEPGTYKIGLLATYPGGKAERSVFLKVEGAVAVAPTSVPGATTTAMTTTAPASTNTATPVPPPPPPPPGAITITSPADGTTVPFKVPVEVKATANLADDVWVFLSIGGRYYPQSDYGNLPATKTGNAWSVVASVGESDVKDVGKTFVFLAATATKSATQTISRDLERWASQQRWPGYSKAELPQGLTLIESSKISVKRCKGFDTCEP